jgi:hypothetical protein
MRDQLLTTQEAERVLQLHQLDEEIMLRIEVLRMLRTRLREPFRIAITPAIVVVLTAPMPTRRMPSFPPASAIF